MKNTYLLIPALTLLIFFIYPKLVQAQEFEGCVDMRGIQVRTILDETLRDVAFAKFGPRGEPIILLNPSVMATYSPKSQRFWYMHECGHHVLGHGFNTTHPLAVEQQADCYSIIILVGSGEFSQSDVKVLQEELSKLGGDWTHLPGPTRAINLQRCLGSSDIPKREIALTKETDSIEVKECLEEKTNKCINACVDGFGYSLERCTNVLCLKTPTNVASWRKSCEKQAAEQKTLSDAKKLTAGLGSFSNILSTIIEASKDNFNSLKGSLNDSDEDTEVYTSKILLSGARNCDIFLDKNGGKPRLICNVLQSDDLAQIKSQFQNLLDSTRTSLSKDWIRDELDSETTYFESATARSPEIVISINTMEGPIGRKKGKYYVSFTVRSK